MSAFFSHLGQNFPSASARPGLLQKEIIIIISACSLITSFSFQVTDFIFFISKLLISIGVGIAVYYLLQWNAIYEVTRGERLHYNYVPAIILSIATYLITTIFFSVYAMAVDTLFLCFCEYSLFVFLIPLYSFDSFND